jgi:hypothetical protein
MRTGVHRATADDLAGLNVSGLTARRVHQDDRATDLLWS